MENLLNILKDYLKLKTKLKSRGFSIIEASILGEIINEKNNEIKINYLCNKYNLNPSYFTRVEKRLIERGFIEEEIFLEDKRYRILKPTDTGKNIYKELEDLF